MTFKKIILLFIIPYCVFANSFSFQKKSDQNWLISHQMNSLSLKVDLQKTYHDIVHDNQKSYQWEYFYGKCENKAKCLKLTLSYLGEQLVFLEKNHSQMEVFVNGIFAGSVSLKSFLLKNKVSLDWIEPEGKITQSGTLEKIDAKNYLWHDNLIEEIYPIQKNFLPFLAFYLVQHNFLGKYLFCLNDIFPFSFKNTIKAVGILGAGTAGILGAYFLLKHKEEIRAPKDNILLKKDQKTQQQDLLSQQVIQTSETKIEEVKTINSTTVSSPVAFDLKEVQAPREPTTEGNSTPRTSTINTPRASIVITHNQDEKLTPLLARTRQQKNSPFYSTPFSQEENFAIFKELYDSLQKLKEAQDANDIKNAKEDMKKTLDYINSSFGIQNEKIQDHFEDFLKKQFSDDSYLLKLILDELNIGKQPSINNCLHFENLLTPATYNPSTFPENSMQHFYTEPSEVLRRSSLNDNHTNTGPQKVSVIAPQEVQSHIVDFHSRLLGAIYNGDEADVGSKLNSDLMCYMLDDLNYFKKLYLVSILLLCTYEHNNKKVTSEILKKLHLVILTKDHLKLEKFGLETLAPFIGLDNNFQKFVHTIRKQFIKQFTDQNSTVINNLELNTGMIKLGIKVQDVFAAFFVEWCFNSKVELDECEAAFKKEIQKISGQ